MLPLALHPALRVLVHKVHSACWAPGNFSEGKWFTSTILKRPAWTIMLSLGGKTQVYTTARQWRLNSTSMLAADVCSPYLWYHLQDNQSQKSPCQRLPLRQRPHVVQSCWRFWCQWRLKDRNHSILSAAFDRQAQMQSTTHYSAMGDTGSAWAEARWSPCGALCFSKLYVESCSLTCTCTKEIRIASWRPSAMLLGKRDRMLHAYRRQLTSTPARSWSRCSPGCQQQRPCGLCYCEV